MIEREIKEPIENEDVVQWANQVNADIGVSINLPESSQVVLNTTDLSYPHPLNMKIITRMWLQSDWDSGVDREYKGKYRIFNGNIIFHTPFGQTDTLNIDYYKQLTYFTSVLQEIDFDDRYTPLYTAYALSKFYKLPSVVARLGDAQARQESENAHVIYLSMKQQILSLYALSNEPTVIKERW